MSIEVDPDEMATDDFLQIQNIQTTSSSSGSDRRKYVIQQDGDFLEVEALHHEDFGNRTVEDFYGYNDGDVASANTPNDMEEEDASQLFFYEGPEQISLVILHDAPRDEEDDPDGGGVRFEFSYLPQSGSWVVKDDSGETNYDREDVNWNWAPCCTDGGVYGGGFEDAFWIEINPEFRDGIEEWVTVDGSEDNLTRNPLQLDQPIAISSIAENANEQASSPTITFSPPSDLCVTTDVDVTSQDVYGFCVDPLEIATGDEFVSIGDDSAAITLGPRNCSTSSAPTNNGKTPPLLSADISYFETEGDEVQLSLTFWVGIELFGERPAIWIGEETQEVCERIGLEEAVENLAAATDDVLDKAENLGRTTVEGLVDLIDDVDIPEWAKVLLAGVFAVIIIIIILYLLAGTGAAVVAGGAAVAGGVGILIAPIVLFELAQ